MGTRAATTDCRNSKSPALRTRINEYKQALAAAVQNLNERGWMDGDDLTDHGREARAAIEAATDASQASLMAACGSALDDIVAGAALISDRLIQARSFPADPRKRAGG